MSTKSLRHFAIPLSTLDPAHRDVFDLEPLRDLIGAARVVAIGESAHGVREFYQLKDRMLRFLVSELGFSAFVMESGFPEGLAVNEWVLCGGGDLDQIARAGITYHFGECAEMRAQLQWMRDWNAAHDRKVRFYGMDVPGSASNPGSGIAITQSLLHPHPEDADLLALGELGEQFEARARYGRMAPIDRERLSKGIAALVGRAKASGNDIAYRCARGVKCLDDLLVNEPAPAPGRYLRDEMMAENVRWILEREQRIVIGAHNGHLLRSSQHGTVLGSILASQLEDDLLVLGTTYARGKLQKVEALDGAQTSFSVSLEDLHPPPQSIDAIMDRVGLPLHMVDLRRLTRETIAAEATSMLVSHDAYDIELRDNFDALIHVRDVSSVTGLVEATRKAIARAEALA